MEKIINQEMINYYLNNISEEVKDQAIIMLLSEDFDRQLVINNILEFWKLYRM